MGVAAKSSDRMTHSLTEQDEEEAKEKYVHEVATEGTGQTEKEEEELAEYLNYGMNLAEAREMRAKELQLAEIKRNMREHRRETERGAINSRGARSAPTRFGTDSRRGRGLTFN